MLLVAAVVSTASCGSDPDNTTLDSAAPAPVVTAMTPATTGPSTPATTAVARTWPPGTPAPDDAPPVELCSDVPYLTTPLISTATDAQIVDPIFRGVLHTYAIEHSDTFGGMWIDRDAGGTILLAFTDDPAPHLTELAARSPQPTDEVGVTPRPPIVDSRPIGEWGVPFDVVQVQFTEATLRGAEPALMEAAQATGLPVERVSAEIRRNRIAVADDELTAAELSTLAAAIVAHVPWPMACIDAVLVDEHTPPIPPGTPIDVIPTPDADGSYPPDLPVACLIGPGPFPLGAFLDRQPLDSLPDLAAAVAAWLAGGEGAFHPQDGWEILHADAGSATVVHVADSGLSVVGFTAGRAGWVWAGSGSGGACDLRAALPDGLGVVTWTLDPAFPEPGRDATELHVVATEQQCSGGRQLGDALLGPQVVETDTAVLIAFAAIPPSGGAQTCPSNPPEPVTITLAAPLGERTVRDGLLVATYADLLAAG